MKSIPLNLPGGSYRVSIGTGLLDEAGAMIRRVAPHASALLVIDRAISRRHGPALHDALQRAGYTVTVAELDAEESDKTLATVQGLYDTMLAARLERQSPVVALGGGIVGDTAGFAAATYLRGVPLVLIPTTLLAMVDASIGGKTGVNHPLPGAAPRPGEKREGQRDAPLGKNLIGSFHQPRAVIVDPHVLSTLPQRELRCGLAECIKHGVIADGELVNVIATNASRIMALDDGALADLITRSVAIKAQVVAADEREAGPRALLNLGHTFAHAIESAQSATYRHGEAVAIGLVAAAHAAVRVGLLEEVEAMVIKRTVEKCGLPVGLASTQDGVDVDALMGAMRYDKKVADGRVRLVLPDALGSARIVEDVAENVVREAWAAVMGSGE